MKYILYDEERTREREKEMNFLLDKIFYWIKEEKNELIFFEKLID